MKTKTNIREISQISTTITATTKTISTKEINRDRGLMETGVTTEGMI